MYSKSCIGVPTLIPEYVDDPTVYLHTEMDF